MGNLISASAVNFHNVQRERNLRNELPTMINGFEFETLTPECHKI